MKKTFLLFLLLFFSSLNLFSQPFNLPLWPEGNIPNHRPSIERETADTSDIIRIRMVQDPDIAVYLPSKKNATGQAVVICPGGGYRILAYDWEGLDIAKWLNANGIAAIVLKYRLPEPASNITPHQTPLLDAQRAMRLTRFHAGEWNIDPGQIGIMGFSAGGHLASTLCVRFDYGNPEHPDPVERISSRPDFSMLIYPVITSDPEFAHQGSFRALIGEDRSDPLYIYYSNELHIREDSPPVILIHSADDRGVPVENSIRYFQAVHRKGIEAEMHIYPYGGHGYSLAIGQGYLSTWPDRVIAWLSRVGLRD